VILVHVLRECVLAHPVDDLVTLRVSLSPLSKLQQMFASILNRLLSIDVARRCGGCCRRPASGRGRNCWLARRCNSRRVHEPFAARRAGLLSEILLPLSRSKEILCRFSRTPVRRRPRLYGAAQLKKLSSKTRGRSLVTNDPFYWSALHTPVRSGAGAWLLRVT
jgi:hypothetical protein